ncbi:resolvase [Streptomyces sp. NPDC021969]|uniref:resolvase n=1 Tax=unclassified Streptomyces TaxID=2593676 RepID=UPI00340BBF1E
MAVDKTADVRTAFLEGRSIAALAREHGVSRGAIRTAVADLRPEHTAIEEDSPAPSCRSPLDMPGKVADFLCAAELEPTERAALDQGVTVPHGQGYTLRVSAVPAVHRQLLAGASRSPAATASPRSRPGARPAASTRTASPLFPALQPDHDRSQHQRLYRCSPRPALHHYLPKRPRPADGVSTR